MPNGKVFCVPYNSTTAIVYDPVTDTTTIQTGSYMTGGFQGGVLMPNGKVFCVPFSSTTAQIYDPVTDTLTTPTGLFPGSSGFFRRSLITEWKSILCSM